MSRRSMRAASWLAVLLLGIAAAPGALGFDGQDELPTAEDVRARLDGLASIEVEDEAALADVLRNTLDALTLIERARARAADFETRVRQEVPERLPLPETNHLSIEQLSEQLAAAENDLTEARREVGRIEDSASERSQRQADLPGEIADAEARLAVASEALGRAPGEPHATERIVLQEARHAAAEAELAALRAEREMIATSRELAPMERDRAIAWQEAAEERRAHLSRALLERRSDEADAADSAARAASDAIDEEFPALRPLATRNAEITSMSTGPDGLPERFRRAHTDLEETTTERKVVEERARSAMERIRVGGVTEGMSRVLRRDFESLPDDSVLRANARNRAENLTRVELETIELREERNRLSDIEQYLDERLAELDVGAVDEPTRQKAIEILEARKGLLEDALTELEDLRSTLYGAARVSENYERAVSGYRSFIEEKILWVRSSPANPWPSIKRFPSDVESIVLAWKEAQPIKALLTQAGDRPFLAFVFVGVILVLLRSRRFLKQTRSEMASAARSYKTDRFLLTVRAIVQTLLLAVPLPALAWAAGELYRGTESGLLHAVGSALREVALVWLGLRFTRGLLADKGVGAAHFKWPSEGVDAVRRELIWFTPVFVISSFVALALDRQSEPAWFDSVGRLAFVVAMASLAVAAHRVLRPTSPIWGRSLEARKGLLRKTHKAWSILAVALPSVLAALSVLGFDYTALQFELRIRATFAFALLLIVVHALLLRWLFVARRRLVVSRALEQRARKAKDPKTDGATEGQSFDGDKVDIPAVDAQTRQLFRSGVTVAAMLGVFLIWSSVLPALKGLDRVQLLPRPAIVDGATRSSIVGEGEPQRVETSLEEAEGNGAPAIPLPLPGAPSAGARTDETGSSESGLPPTLTLAQVAIALIFLTLTIVAARNLPALLELSLLQRLPIDHGARFAISTLVRYLILIIGVSAVSGALGISWQQIQWLAAALTFGLAFGLQEIFANFVSGIIILIERPVRVGDIVTVGGTEGRVTQLRMRATTILDWDRREFLVPNKEFITGSVVNWTLSDSITRIIISVGIAYGSDTRAARKILYGVARANELVIDDPPPAALFRKFGDSTLDFELRVFVENRDVWPQLIDSLHEEIDRAFRNAGIEIAFPQRDLHLRSSDVEGLGAQTQRQAKPDQA